MRVEYSIGCMSDGLTVDNHLFVHLSEEQKAEVKKRLCEWFEKQDNDLQRLLCLLAEHFHDEYKCGDPCPQCGDYVETFILEI